jgi:hypothetical protein
MFPSPTTDCISWGFELHPKYLPTLLALGRVEVFSCFRKSYTEKSLSFNGLKNSAFPSALWHGRCNSRKPKAKRKEVKTNEEYNHRFDSGLGDHDGNDCRDGRGTRIRLG